METPTPEIYYIETPLYKKTKITESNFEEIQRIEFFKGTLDTYCVDCEKESVFRFRLNKLQELLAGGVPATNFPLGKGTPRLVSSTTKNAADEPSPRTRAWMVYCSQPRTYPIEFECTRDKNHVLYFFVRIQDSEIMKVGQYPTLADLQGIEIKRYRQVLGGESYSEFNRAIGLSSHGVGIGAFVYLRRIFESLIEEARLDAMKDKSWNDNVFIQSRMDEKIEILKVRLPIFLVENRSMYSILSNGVHELKEDECLEFFEPLRVAIELILDEKIKKIEESEKIKKTEAALVTIKSRLRRGNGG
jgi:hypothetical protein